jgi:hypothetical protein
VHKIGGILDFKYSIFRASKIRDAPSFLSIAQEEHVRYANV